MKLSPLERGKGCVKKPFLDNYHTPLPLSRGDLIKSVPKSLLLNISYFQAITFLLVFYLQQHANEHGYYTE